MLYTILQLFINQYYIPCQSICDGRYGTPTQRFYDHFNKEHPNIVTFEQLNQYMTDNDLKSRRGHSGRYYPLNRK